MPRGVRSAQGTEIPIDWRIAGVEDQLVRLRREQRTRFGELAVTATVYLMDRGHRPTGETMAAHFGDTCRCKQEVGDAVAVE